MIDIVAEVLKKKQTKIKAYPCHVNRASSLGRFVPELEGCLRQGVYERTSWDKKELHDARVQAIFDEGNLQEDAVLKDLADADITVLEQQRPYEWKDHQITGHIDGKIIIDGKAIPVEIKSMNPYIFDQIHSFEDMRKKSWTRAYMAQLTLYMLMQGVETGIFILKNKSTGELRQLNCVLDYELGEQCLKAAEAINKHVKENTLPDRIQDREKCKDCPFKMLCLPEIQWGSELKIADDPEFERRIDGYLSKKDTALECDKEYEIIKSRAKASVDDRGELNVLIGKYHLTGKPDSRRALRIKIDQTF